MNKPLSADTRRRIQKHIQDLQNPDQDLARTAEVRLIRFGREALSALVAVANHPDPCVRYRAVWALGKTRDERAFPTILALTHDPDPRVAYDALMALGELGTLRAIPRLQEVAAIPDDDHSLDNAATMALVKLGALSVDPDGRLTLAAPDTAEPGMGPRDAPNRWDGGHA